MKVIGARQAYAQVEKKPRTHRQEVTQQNTQQLIDNKIKQEVQMPGARFRPYLAGRKFNYYLLCQFFGAEFSRSQKILVFLSLSHCLLIHGDTITFVSKAIEYSCS